MKIPVNPSQNHPFGQDVKIVCHTTRRYTHLTDEEKDAIVRKYQGGMTMMALAAEYQCHHTTVGRLLRKRGAKVRTV